MWSVLIRRYAESKSEFGRIPKTRWISFIMDLGNFSVPPEAGEITLIQATQGDMEALRHHPEAGENIFHSALKFWDANGFRSMFLGYYGDDSDPSVFQYVLDHSANSLYSKMEYGGMYLPQSRTSVQVENLYVFKGKRRKNVALHFEWALFGLLKERGTLRVRTHIAAQNLPAIGWARKVGLGPDAWITRVSLNLPGFRTLRPRFVYSPIRLRDYEEGPLAGFR